MKWGQMVLGFSVGLFTGAILSQTIKGQTISSEQALKLVKQAFKEEGPIDGSWIHVIPEAIERNKLKYEVFRGGITRTVNNEVEQYEFLVDAKTGSILELASI
ncbi:PepSY domain-containing protein [Bacillus sp. Marseille-P3661]|uniref:PepSY domain-containing protein n=1 Tax=Bacillus sp. Marseille-P3661 TaxID=1936234 RepID=UPI000C84F610|nr:PepSY domain-containing protein [Bacillus sp. Marseille-P3661]